MSDLESFENPETLQPLEGRHDRRQLMPYFRDLRAAIAEMLLKLGAFLAKASTPAPATHWLISAAQELRIEPILYAKTIAADAGPSFRYPRAMFDADAVSLERDHKPVPRVRLAIIVMLQRAPRSSQPPPQKSGDTSGMAEDTDSFDHSVLAPVDLTLRQSNAFFWLRSVQYILADVLVAALLEFSFTGFLAQSFARATRGWVQLAAAEDVGGLMAIAARIVAKQRVVVLLPDPAAPSEPSLLAGGAHFWSDADQALFTSVLKPEQQRLVALWAHTFAAWIQDVPTGAQWMNWLELVSPPCVPTLRAVFPSLLLHDLRIVVGATDANTFASTLPGGRTFDPVRLNQWIYVTSPGDLMHVWHPGGRAESESETRLVTNDRIADALYRRLETAIGVHNHDMV